MFLQETRLPLPLGRYSVLNTSTTVQIYVTNVQVYDVALPADFIAENYKLSGLDELGKKIILIGII